MPSPEFERDRALFELNVLQIALQETRRTLAAVQKDLDVRYDWVRDNDISKREIREKRYEYKLELQKLETIKTFKELAAGIATAEQELERLRVENIAAQKANESLRNELRDVLAVGKLPNLVEEFEDLKQKVAELKTEQWQEQSKLATLRSIRKIGEGSCLICRRLDKPRTSTHICSDCIGAALLELQKSETPPEVKPE